MNELKLFENPEFGSVRAMEIGGESWFVGRDICRLFGDKNESRSLSRVDDADKQIIQITDTMGRSQNAIIVNESGLYSLLFAMQPQKANHDGVSDAYPIEIQQRIEKLRGFKRWVTHDVIPSIRKHGAYMTDETLEKALLSPDFLIQLATELKTEKEKNRQLETKIEKDKPKTIFADAVSASASSILVGDLAKLIRQNGYNIGQKRLFSWMRDNGYLMKSGSSYNLPTQYSMEREWFEIKETTVVHADGHTTVNKTPKVTGKGQIYFINLFLQGGEDDA